MPRYPLPRYLLLIQTQSRIGFTGRNEVHGQAGACAAELFEFDWHLNPTSANTADSFRTVECPSFLSVTLVRLHSDMRILHISTRLILGGSQENTILSCEGQARLGHDVHLAFGPIYGPEGSMLDRVNSFRTSDGRGITTHVIPDMVREIHPLRDWRTYRQLRALIARIKPDIVHTHSSKAGIIGRAAGWADEQRRARYAIALDEYNERFPPISFLGIVHTIHGPPFMPVEGPPLKRFKTCAVNAAYVCAERFAAKRCHTIVSVADAMTREFQRRRIGKPKQFVTVYSGMEVERFLTPTNEAESRHSMRHSLGFDDNDFVIGTVARLAEHKGHDDLLDALADDLKANPNWKLLWVGDGWWRERLLARAREIGLRVLELDRCAGSDNGTPDRVETEGGIEAAPHQSNGKVKNSSTERPDAQVVLAGLVPPERVAAMMRAMDVLAHPSYREGLPRTVPQSLLVGVCPVAYDVDGTGEACIDGETGRLVPLANRIALRDAIRWCANNPPERVRLAELGQMLCRERFSASRMVQELESVYAQAIEVASGKR